MSIRRFLICCFLLPLCCAAVKPYTPKTTDPLLQPWRWRHEEALEDLNVLCMDEAPDGTLWFGNIGSIAYYDGRSVTTIPFDEDFLSEITHSKELPWAKALIVLPDGRIVVLIGESLVLRDNDRWNLLIRDVGESVFSARLKQMDDGTVWLLVPGALWQISSDLKVCTKVLQPGSGNELLSFCMDEAGGIWVVEKTGVNSSRLVHFPGQDNGTGLKIDEGAGFPIPLNDVVQEARITAGDDGLIWYVNSSSLLGFRAFDPVQKIWVNPAERVVEENAFSILKSRTGVIFGAGDGGVLSFSDQKGVSFYSCKQLGLPRVPYSLFESADNRLWAIGRIGYVFSVDLSTEEWKTYPGLNFQCETPEGVQWFLVLYNHSLVSYDSGTGEWLEYGPEDHHIDKVYLLFHSRNGFIWAAGQRNRRAAVSVFDGTSWTRLEHPEFAYWIRPNAVFESSDGTVWFGAGGTLLEGDSEVGGALRFKVNVDRQVELLKHYAPPDFPYYVTAFEQTPDGEIWIGSTEIFQYDETSPEARRVESVGGENTVAMVLDHDRHLWVAKENLGVCQWTGDTWRVFTAKDGLAGTKLMDLLVLSDGALLAASNEGISRYDGRSWTPYAYSDLFAMNTVCGMFQTGDGAVWLNYTIHDKQMIDIVPETIGFCSIRHRPEQNPPDTQFVDCLERVAQPGNTFVTWTGRDFWSSTTQEELQYSWRMDAGEWSVFSPETGRTFLKLASGKHTLEVRARDRAFNMDPTPASTEFFVIPPVWQQTWFVSLISFLLALIAFFLWRWMMVREQRLREQQEQREAFIVRQKEEREAELRGELVSLHESLEKLEKELEQTRKPLIYSGMPEDDPDREFLDRLMSVLSEHYSDWEFTREDLAQAFNMSLRTFQRKLKAVSARGPKELIREFRVIRSAELLAHTSLSVSDIAFRTGHDDSGNFARIFKKHFGVTPTEYRAGKTN